MEMDAFACDAFVLLEKKSLFYSAKWQPQRLELSRELLEFSSRPQVVLRFQSASYVVLRGVASADEASSSGKQKLLLDVRSMEEVRKAWVYQTAAKTSRLDLYVGDEATHDRILAFTNNQSTQPQVPTAVLPEQVPYAVPVIVPHAHAAAASIDNRDAPPSTPSTTNLKLLIEDSFQALADAQASMDTDKNHHDINSMETALAKYRAADQGFAEAARLVPDERTRQLFQERRQEIQSVIRTLEDALDKKKRPNAAISLLMGITDMGFSDALQQQQQPVAPGGVPASTVSVGVTTTTNSSTTTATTATTASELDERLERLKNFAAQQDVERAQRERKPAPDALRLRLHALRNEKVTTPSVESLEERFQRLRGGLPTSSPTGEETRGVGETAVFNRQSSVDRIIQQVQEEIALGIVDDELEGCDDDKGGGDDGLSNSGSEEDENDESSSNDSEQDTRHRKSGAKREGKSTSTKRSRR